MVPDHGTQYEENPSDHHRGMREEGLTDGLTNRLMARLMDQTLSYIPQFYLGGAENNNIQLRFTYEKSVNPIQNFE